MSEHIDLASMDGKRLYDLLGPEVWRAAESTFWEQMEVRMGEYDRWSWQHRSLRWWRTWVAGSTLSTLVAMGGRPVEDVCTGL